MPAIEMPISAASLTDRVRAYVSAMTPIRQQLLAAREPGTNLPVTGTLAEFRALASALSDLTEVTIHCTSDLDIT